MSSEKVLTPIAEADKSNPAEPALGKHQKTDIDKIKWELNVCGLMSLSTGLENVNLLCPLLGLPKTEFLGLDLEMGSFQWTGTILYKEEGERGGQGCTGQKQTSIILILIVAGG